MTITLILKELVWESEHNPWLNQLHGTPASGAGIIGCLDTGVSVIALCENVHHHKHLDIALRQRAVEAMLAGSRIFKHEALQARALEFCPMTTVKKEKEKEKEKEKNDENNDAESEADDSDSDSEEKKDKKKNDKKEKKEKKNDKKRKRKSSVGPESQKQKKQQSQSDSDSSD